MASAEKETLERPASESEGLGLTVALHVPQRGPRRTEKQAPPAPAPVIAEPEVSHLQSKKGENKAVLEFLDHWKHAWEQKDLDSYAKMYHPKFRQGSMDYKAFLKSKRTFFGKYRTIRVEIDKVETVKEKGRLLVRFLQSFQGDGYRDKGWKSMVLAGGKGEGLRIVEEQWSSSPGGAAHSGAQSP